MPYSCETVRIVSPVSADNPHGFIVINKSDFDPKQHELFAEKKIEAQVAKSLGVKKVPAADPAGSGVVVPLNPAYVAPLSKPEA